MNKINEKFPPSAQRKLTAGLVGILVCLLTILLFEEKRGESLRTFFLMPLGSLQELGELVAYATPMVFVALATALVFQCRRYSLSMIGSFMLSACLTTGFLLLGNEQPAWYLVPSALVISILAGAGAAAIPAALSIRRRVNITISSLILDFLILQLTSFILSNYMWDPAAGQSASFEIPERLWLPEILPALGLRFGFLLAAAAVVLLYLLLYRGRLGYEIRAVGASESMAGYVGLSYGKTVMAVQLLAGALAGLGGAVEMMGVQPRYIWDGSFPTVALLGILAAVVAGYRPLWIPLSCLFFGYLWRGGVLLNESTGFPVEVPLFAAAVMVLLLLAMRDLDVFRAAAGLFQKKQAGDAPAQGMPPAATQPQTAPRRAAKRPAKAKQQKTDAKLPADVPDGSEGVEEG